MVRKARERDLSRVSVPDPFAPPGEARTLFLYSYSFLYQPIRLLQYVKFISVLSTLSAPMFGGSKLSISLYWQTEKKQRKNRGLMHILREREAKRERPQDGKRSEERRVGKE